MSKANVKELSIIIVTYNSAKIIAESLANLDAELYDIYVIDNASIDETVELVTQKFPKVKLINSDKNSGFARANNLALRQINTEFALVLNPDALIAEKTIAEMLQILKKDRDIALAAPLLVSEQKVSKQYLEKRLEKINKDFLGKQQIYFEKLGTHYNAKFLSGAVLFMRREIFANIGFFDEHIFMFYEDNEIVQRSLKHKYKNLLITECQAYHKAGNSSQNNQKNTNLYKKGWHLKGWSKCYLEEKKSGLFQAKIKSISLCSLCFAKVILQCLRLNRVRAVLYAGGLVGALSYLLGMAAFDKNGYPRG